MEQFKHSLIQSKVNTGIDKEKIFEQQLKKLEAELERIEYYSNKSKQQRSDCKDQSPKASYLLMSAQSINSQSSPLFQACIDNPAYKSVVIEEKENEEVKEEVGESQTQVKSDNQDLDVKWESNLKGNRLDIEVLDEHPSPKPHTEFDTFFNSEIPIMALRSDVMSEQTVRQSFVAEEVERQQKDEQSEKKGEFVSDQEETDKGRRNIITQMDQKQLISDSESEEREESRNEMKVLESKVIQRSLQLRYSSSKISESMNNSNNISRRKDSIQPQFQMDNQPVEIGFKEERDWIEQKEEDSSKDEQIEKIEREQIVQDFKMDVKSVESQELGEENYLVQVDQTDEQKGEKEAQNSMTRVEETNQSRNQYDIPIIPSQDSSNHELKDSQIQRHNDSQDFIKSFANSAKLTGKLKLKVRTNSKIIKQPINLIQLPHLQPILQSLSMEKQAEDIQWESVGVQLDLPDLKIQTPPKDKEELRDDLSSSEKKVEFREECKSDQKLRPAQRVDFSFKDSQLESIDLLLRTNQSSANNRQLLHTKSSQNKDSSNSNVQEVEVELEDDEKYDIIIPSIDFEKPPDSLKQDQQKQEDFQNTKSSAFDQDLFNFLDTAFSPFKQALSKQTTERKENQNLLISPQLNECEEGIKQVTNGEQKERLTLDQKIQLKIQAIKSTKKNEIIQQKSQTKVINYGESVPLISDSHFSQSIQFQAQDFDQVLRKLPSDKSSSKSSANFLKIDEVKVMGSELKMKERKQSPQKNFQIRKLQSQSMDDYQIKMEISDLVFLESTNSNQIETEKQTKSKRKVSADLRQSLIYQDLPQTHQPPTVPNSLSNIQSLQQSMEFQDSKIDRKSDRRSPGFGGQSKNSPDYGSPINIQDQKQKKSDSKSKQLVGDIDTRSNQSIKSKLSKFTNNLQSKNTKVNEQWYQFIYNDNLLNDSASNCDDRSQVSRFTLKSKASVANKSQISSFRKQNTQQIEKVKQTMVNASTISQTALEQKLAGFEKKGRRLLRDPLLKLREMLEEIDIFKIIKLQFLLAPLIDSRLMLKRLFNFDRFQVRQISQRLQEDAVNSAIFNYLAGEVEECLKICEEVRKIFKDERTRKVKVKQFDSIKIGKIYGIQLACLIGIITSNQSSPEIRKQRVLEGYSIIEEIPIFVKNRQQLILTIIELMINYKGQRAFTKLKDLDFITYKLFKLERAINIDRLGLKDDSNDASKFQFLDLDQDEKAGPDKYAREIQRQFSKLDQSQYLKKLEYFIYGALSAMKNHHYSEAWNFVSQSPFICNFGEQITDIETLLTLEMLKMVEIKLLTKIGRPEQAIISLCNRIQSKTIVEDPEFLQLFPFTSQQLSYFEFESDMFMDRQWSLCKSLKYRMKLIELQQDHFRLKVVKMLSRDYNKDAKFILKINYQLIEILFHLRFINSHLHNQATLHQTSNSQLSFLWLLLKQLFLFEADGRIHQIAQNPNYSLLIQSVDILKELGQLLQLPSQIQESNQLIKKLREELLSPHHKRLLQLNSHKNVQIIIQALNSLEGKDSSTLNVTKMQSNASFFSQNIHLKNQKAILNNSPNQFHIAVPQPHIDSQKTTAISALKIQGSSMKQQGYPINRFPSLSSIDFCNLQIKDVIYRIEKSQPYFYQTLQNLIDLVGQKLNYLQQYQFMREVVKVDRRVKTELEYQSKALFINYFDLVFTQPKRSLSREWLKCKLVDQYGESPIIDDNLFLFQSDSPKQRYKFRKIQIESILKSMNSLLQKTPIIVFQNLSEVEEISQRQMRQCQRGEGMRMKSSEQLKGVETVYLNQELLENQEEDQCISLSSHSDNCSRFIEDGPGYQDSQFQPYSHNKFQEFPPLPRKTAQFQTNINQVQSSQKDQSQVDITELKMGSDLDWLKRTGYFQKHGIDTSEDSNIFGLTHKHDISSNDSKSLAFEGGESDNTHQRGRQQGPSPKKKDSKRITSKGDPKKQISSVKHQSSSSQSPFKEKGNQNTNKSRNKSEIRGFQIDESEFIQEGPNSSKMKKIEFYNHSSGVRNSLKSSQNRSYSLGTLRSQKPRNSVQQQSDWILNRSPKIQRDHSNQKNSGTKVGDRLKSRVRFGDETMNEKERRGLGHNSIFQDHHSAIEKDISLRINQNNYTRDDGSEKDLRLICRDFDQIHLKRSLREDLQHLEDTLMQDGISREYDEEEMRFEEESEKLESDSDSDISISNLLQTDEEKLNYQMLKHSIYEPDVLYLLLMGCCLSDSNYNLAFRLLNILIKIRYKQRAMEINVQDFLLTLEVVQAYVFTRMSLKLIEEQEANQLSQSLIDLSTVHPGHFHHRSTLGDINSQDLSELTIQRGGQKGVKQKILMNLQKQDYYLQQAYKCMKEVEVERVLQTQRVSGSSDQKVDQVVLMMFLYVQNQFIALNIIKSPIHFNKSKIYSLRKIRQPYSSNHPPMFELVGDILKDGGSLISQPSEMGMSELELNDSRVTKGMRVNRGQQQRVSGGCSKSQMEMDRNEKAHWSVRINRAKERNEGEVSYFNQ